MIQAGMAAFAGCFAALVVLAEIQMQSKLARYIVCFVVGILVTLAALWALEAVARAFRLI